MPANAGVLVASGRHCLTLPSTDSTFLMIISSAKRLSDGTPTLGASTNLWCRVTPRGAVTPEAIANIVRGGVLLLRESGGGSALSGHIPNAVAVRKDLLRTMAPPLGCALCPRFVPRPVHSAERK